MATPQQPLMTLEPNGMLTFNITENKAAQSVISLSNNTSRPLGFKVKTTQPKRYQVRPNQGMVDAGKTVEVAVILVMKECAAIIRDGLDETNDKFLVQSMEIPPTLLEKIVTVTSEEQADMLSHLWQSTNKKEISNQKLLVRFRLDSSSAPGNISGSQSGAVAGQIAHEEKLKERLHHSGTTSADTSSRGMTSDLKALSKKYEELVSFTVQLTAERDSLMGALEQATKREVTLVNEMKQRRGDGSGDSGDVRKRDGVVAPATTGGGDSMSITKILLACFIGFLMGRFLG